MAHCERAPPSRSIGGGRPASARSEAQPPGCPSWRPALTCALCEPREGPQATSKAQPIWPRSQHACGKCKRGRGRQNPPRCARGALAARHQRRGGGTQLVGPLPRAAPPALRCRRTTIIRSRTPDTPDACGMRLGGGAAYAVPCQGPCIATANHVCPSARPPPAAPRPLRRAGVCGAPFPQQRVRLRASHHGAHTCLRARADCWWQHQGFPSCLAANRGRLLAADNLLSRGDFRTHRCMEAWRARPRQCPRWSRGGESAHSTTV